MQKSITFYEALGFTIDERWEDNGKLLGVMLRAGKSQIGLSQDDWKKGRDRKKGIGVRLIGLVPRFPVAVGLLVVWGLLFATVTPVRQGYLNELIPSEQRATGLSFDSLMGSGGGVIVQPLLGKAADVWGYPASYLYGATIQLLASPFIWLVRRERPDL